MVEVPSLEMREVEYEYGKRPHISDPETAEQILRRMIRDQNKESFITLYLDTKNKVLRQEVISVGSLNASIVTPREVFKSACVISAANILVAHNHPSGDPAPSKEDIAMTKKLHEAGGILEIPLLDHIILGKTSFISMKQDGYI